MKKISLLVLTLISLHQFAKAQCTPGQDQIKVVLLTDTYPQETEWKIYDNNNTVLFQSIANLAQSTLYVDSFCVPTGACYHFKITDAAGDGICCGYGFGHFEVYLNNVLVKKDSSFGSNSSAWMGCPPGQSCDAAVLASQGFQTAPGPNTWYEFNPPTTGMYTVSTCSLGNTCDTKLWMYDYCTNLVYDSTNVATIYYANNNCGTDATINAYLLSNHTYYVRVGDANSSCTNTPINWEINYNGSLAGCLDTVACNFNPFAAISDPSSCLYYPDALCPTGSDLAVDSGRLSTTIIMDTSQSNSVCTIREGCMNGYGPRELIRFDTKIANIGATDFYAGTPPSSPNAYSPIFEFDQCHNHWHFEDYAEYLLADSLNNFIPIGYKNGFCVLDLTCSTGSPKFGCNNMGITSGCADIYGAYLDCQWVDITDISDGNYKLILRVNWRPRPDFYGRYETSYFNNWARACIKIYHDGFGHRQVDVLPNCAPYIDCNGDENGLAVKDCDGNCNGTRLTGDLNIDNFRNATDVTNYMLGAINYTIPASKCNDLNDDQEINVTDAALLFDCVRHGPGSIPTGHSHEPCRFPDKIKNPFQHSEFSLTNLDTVAKTIDISIRNDDSKILGYQLNIKGIHVTGVQNAMTGFTPTIHFRPTGQIIVLTNDEVPIPKNQSTTTLLRLSYDYVQLNQICIDSIKAVVNDAFEEIAFTTVDSVCLTATPNNTSIGIVGSSTNHSIYPNPFSKSTSLVLENPKGESYEVLLYDVYGSVVRKYPVQKANTLVIEKGALSPGVYFMEVTSAKWQFKEKLIID
jgi:hypothetical protein